MSSTVLAEQASIRTATVEVRAIRIGAKQMTQSVFKQLPEEPYLSHETAQPLGDCWGWVNYHSGCEESGTHLHVIWQKGPELRRALLEDEPSVMSAGGLTRWHGWREQAVKSLRYWAMVSTALGVWEHPRAWVEASQWERDQPHFELHTRIRGRVFRWRPDQDLKSAWGRDGLIASAAVKDLKAKVAPLQADPAAFLREVAAYAIQLQGFEDAWAASYQAAYATGQLFIAV